MEENYAIHKGRIEDVGLLNLLYAKTPEDLAGIQSIEDVGCILIPEHLGGSLARISMEDVGTIVPVPQDGKVCLVAGQGRFTGEAMAQGDPETLLVIAGQAIITSVVEKVGFRGIHVAGQIFAPTGSEAALTAAMTSLLGQSFYYKAGSRMFQGHDRIGREFLELVDNPIPLMISGHLEIDDDVTPDLLKAKVSEIALYGHLQVPRALYALAQFLTVDNSGHLEARG